MAVLSQRTINALQDVKVPSDPKRYTFEPVPDDVWQGQLREAMRAAGVVPLGGLDGFSPVRNGAVHRFDVEGDRQGQVTGAYMLYPDDPPAGWFQDWRRGEPIKWCLDYSKLRDVAPYEAIYRQSQTPEFKAAQEARRQDRARRDKEAAEAARAKAEEEFNNASPAPLDHPYLRRKMISDIDSITSLRLDRFGNLLVPVRDVLGKFLSMQRIRPEKDEGGNDKYFAGGTKPGGGFFLLGDLDAGQDIYVCEGAATAFSVHEARAELGPTVAALNCNNIKAVCNSLRQKYPTRKIFIMADDDVKTLVKTGKNPGKAAAVECLKKRLCDGVCPPVFNRTLDTEEPSDWNDYMSRYGLEKTKEALSLAVMEAKETMRLTGRAAIVEAGGGSVADDARLLSITQYFDKEIEIPPTEMIGGLFPRGRVTVVAGAAGVGKTWFLTRLAADLSIGGSILGGFATVTPCKLLILEGEAGFGLVLERLKQTSWAIDKERVPVVDFMRSQENGVELCFDMAEGLINFRRLIDIHNPDVVFVDSLFNFTDHTDENKGAEVSPLMKSMMITAKEKNIALVLNHHIRKRKAKEQFMPLTQDDMIGSSFFARNVGLILGLRPTDVFDENAPVLVQALKSWFKYPKKFTFQLVEGFYGGTDMVFDLSPKFGTNKGSSKEQKEDQVESYIHENYDPGEEFRCPDLLADLSKNGISISERALRRLLASLAKEGVLFSKGKCKNTKYHVPTEEEVEALEAEEENKKTFSNALRNGELIPPEPEPEEGDELNEDEEPKEGQYKLVSPDEGGGDTEYPS